MGVIIKLLIDNSICKIEGINQENFKNLADILSYKLDDKSAFFLKSHRKYTKQSLLTKRGEFPTGLLYLVKKWLAINKATYLTQDLRKIPKSRETQLDLNTGGCTPYPEQEEASKAAVTHKRGIICAPTGVGKSMIVALIIKALNVPTLVVVPSLELKRQLFEFLKIFFGSHHVGRLGLNTIAVENVDALNANEEDTKGYHCVIIDEFHHSGAKTYRRLNKKAWKNIYYKFGLTATPFRSQDNERLLLESVLSKVIYRVEYKDAVNKKYIVPLEAYYYDLPKTATEGYTWHEVYNELVVTNSLRNTLISKLLINLKDNHCSTLCLVKEIAHGELLSLATGIPFANGQAEDSSKLIKDFSEKKINSLIATTGFCGEGVDTKAAEYIVIAGLGKSKNAFMQQCGRGFRQYEGKESCKVILFRDSSHKWTLQHFNSQLKYLRDEYSINAAKLEGET